MLTKVSVQELLTKADTQYEVVKKLHQLLDDAGDVDVGDLYRAQLLIYADLMQQVKVTTPRLIELKLKEILVDINQFNNPELTPEIVSQTDFLLDLAKSLGWVEPQPKAPVYTCEICGFRGQLGVTIVERPYHNPLYDHDSTRWECADYESCLTRTGH